MTEFLVESYRSDTSSGSGEDERARRGAQELTSAGTPVRFVRSIFLPDEETCLLLYEADSEDAVRAAATRAGLAFERVVETG